MTTSESLCGQTTAVLCDFWRVLATADEAVSLDWSGYKSHQEAVNLSLVTAKRQYRSRLPFELPSLPSCLCSDYKKKIGSLYLGVKPADCKAYRLAVGKKNVVHPIVQTVSCDLYVVHPVAAQSAGCLTYNALTHKHMIKMLMQTDADWTCWLAAEARVWKHKHKSETDSDSCHTVHRLCTACKWFSAGCCCRCIKDGRPDAAWAAISWRHHWHAQEMLPTRFQKTAQSEQHWYSNTFMEGFICHKLKIINKGTSRLYMPWRWVLKVCFVLHNYKQNNYVMMICVIFLPKCTQA